MAMPAAGAVRSGAPVGMGAPHSPWRPLSLGAPVPRTVPRGGVRPGARGGCALVVCMAAPEGSRKGVLGRALGGGVRLFLKSQLEECEGLEVSVYSSSRNLIRGHIDALEVVARGAVYKGLCLSSLRLTSSAVDVNIGGESVLEHEFTVAADVELSEDDLTKSLSKPLLQGVLPGLLAELGEDGGAGGGGAAGGGGSPRGGVDVEGTSLDGGTLRLTGSRRPGGEPWAADLSVAVRPGGRWLDVVVGGGGGAEGGSKEYDLGPGTEIRKLEIVDGALSLQGNFLVTP